MNDVPAEKSFHKFLWFTLLIGLILCAVAGALTLPDEWFQARMDTFPRWFRTYGMPFFIGLVRGDFLREAVLLSAASVVTYLGAVQLIYKSMAGQSEPYFQGKSLKDLFLSKPEIPFFLLLIYMIFSAAFLSPSFYHGIASAAYLGGCLLIAVTARGIPVSDKFLKQLKRSILFVGLYISAGLMAKAAGWEKFLPEINTTAAPYWLAIAAFVSFSLFKNHKGICRGIAGLSNLFILAGVILFAKDYFLGKPTVSSFTEFPLHSILWGGGSGYTEIISVFDPSYTAQRGHLPGIFNIVAQVGLIGGALFATGLVSALRAGIDNVRNDPQKLFLWHILLFLLVCSLFSNPLKNASVAFLASVSIGVILSQNTVETRKLSPAKIKKVAAFGFALPVAVWLGFVLSYLVFKPFISHVLTQEGRRWLALAYTDTENNHEQLSQRLNYARGVFRNAVVSNVFNSEAYLGQASAYVELAEQTLNQIRELDDSVTTDSAVLEKGLRMVIDSHISSSRMILFHPVKNGKLRFPYHQSMSYLLLGRGHDITARSMEETTATQTVRDEFDKAAQFYSRIPDNTPESEKAKLFISRIAQEI